MVAESKIEKTTCLYAGCLGWLSVKMEGFHKRGIPDRLFLKAPGKVFWMEFKAPGQKLNKAQQAWFDLLRAMGFEVFVVDDIEQGKQIVNRMDREALKDGTD